MRATSQIFLTAAMLATLSACAVAPPSGPTVVAMPATGEPFQKFQRDDADCRQFAASRVNTLSAQQQQNNQVGTAVAGTALGAAAGALLGAASGRPGAGAAIGAGIGLAGGSAVAADQTQGGAYSAQRSYDIAYSQCMVGHGDRVPAYQYRGPSYGPGYAPPGYAP